MGIPVRLALAVTSCLTLSIAGLAQPAAAEDIVVPGGETADLGVQFLVGPENPGGGPACSVQAGETKFDGPTPPAPNSYAADARALCQVSGVSIVVLSEFHRSSGPTGSGSKIGSQTAGSAQSPAVAMSRSTIDFPPAGYLYLVAQGRYTFNYDVKNVTLGPRCFRSSARVIVCNTAGPRTQVGPRLVG
jgi:hypothetical protein